MLDVVYPTPTSPRLSQLALDWRSTSVTDIHALADERLSFPDIRFFFFFAYVLISSARVEMSNKFVTLHSGNPRRPAQM